MKDWLYVAKWSGLGFIVAGIIGNIYQGFNNIVLGLYILGIFLFLSWALPQYIKK